MSLRPVGTDVLLAGILVVTLAGAEVAWLGLLTRALNWVLRAS